MHSLWLIRMLALSSILILTGCGTGMESPGTVSSGDPSSEARGQTSPLPNVKGVQIPPESRPYITVATVDPEAASGLVRAPGRVDFRQKAVSGVGAVIAGRVMKVHVQAGDKVRANTPLITLSSPDAGAARAKLNRARVELQSAEEMVRRQAEMFKRGVGLEVEKFKAEMHLKEAKAEFDRASQAVTFLGEGTGETVAVRAPIDGTVLRLKATVGAMVQPGENLIELGDPAALWVVADVFERDLPLVREGAEATVELATISSPIRGRVVAIGAALETELRRAPVYIELKDRGLALRPGMYARVTLSGAHAERILLPVAAVLIKDGKRTIVYVENDDSTFQSREVVVGQSIEGRVPVIEGLAPGERVVVRGALLLDGEAEQLL
jgi:membrane fusion protein, heavy metal efflux system